jgi:polar amino acid transport system substrate-binding protein
LVLKLLFCFVLLVVVLSAKADTQAERTVLFLAPEYPPYSSERLPGRGAAVKLLQLMLQNSGFKPVVEFKPWARVVHELQNGQVDGALLLWPVEVSQFNMLSTSPIFISRLGFYLRRSELTTTNVQLQAMAKKRVCTVRGYIYPPELKAAKVVFDEAVDDLTNLKRVSLGRCDYVALERAVGEYLLQTPQAGELKAEVVWAEPAFIELPLSFAVTSTKADAAALALALQQGLEKIRKNQQYQQLLERYDLDLPEY